MYTAPYLQQQQDEILKIASVVRDLLDPVQLRVSSIAEVTHILLCDLCEKLSKHLSDEHKLEYDYRKARVYHELDQLEDALIKYDETIRIGESRDYYYACNAALQSGLIYERLDRPASAKRYYEKCLDISPSDYQTSLHQKAKAGLDRLRAKQ